MPFLASSKIPGKRRAFFVPQLAFVGHLPATPVRHVTFVILV